MKKLYILILGVFGTLFTGTAQTTFQVQAGNNNHDWNCVGIQTSDGGYAAVSTHEEFGDMEICLLRMDFDGSFLWSKTYTGTGGAHEARDLKQTSDGGFIICGTLNESAFGDMAYLIKTNSTGDTLWTRTYVASSAGGGAYGYAVQQTTDGGYILTGNANIVTGNYNDLLLMKIAANGDLTWTRVFGGFSDDYGYAVQQTSDGGYIAAGKTFSWGWGATEIYLVKTSSNGLLLWAGAYGTTGIEEGSSVRQTSDGGFVVGGYTSGFGAGFDDLLMMKTTANGAVQWAKAYGTTTNDIGYSARQTSDGGYILAGYGGSVSALAVKTNSLGDTVWTRAYGTTFADQFFSVVNSWDGGYVFCGETGSFQGNWEDIYLVKTDAEGNSGCYQPSVQLFVASTTLQDSMVNSSESSVGSINPHLTVIETPVIEDSIMCVHVGIHGLEQMPSLVISPNPFENELFVQGTSHKGVIVIYDLLGNEMKRQQAVERKTTIEANDLSSGLYFYIYFEENKFSAGKVVKH